MIKEGLWTRLKKVIRYYKNLPNSETPPSRIPAYATGQLFFSQNDHNQLDQLGFAAFTLGLPIPID